MELVFAEKLKAQACGVTGGRRTRGRCSRLCGVFGAHCRATCPSLARFDWRRRCQRLGCWRPVVCRQLRLLGIACSSQILIPAVGAETFEVLIADGGKGQAVLAAEFSQRRDVAIAVYGALAERNTPVLQMRASLVAGGTVFAGVDRDRVAIGDLTQFVRQLKVAG